MAASSNNPTDLASALAAAAVSTNRRASSFFSSTSARASQVVAGVAATSSPARPHHVLPLIPASSLPSSSSSSASLSRASSLSASLSQDDDPSDELETDAPVGGPVVPNPTVVMQTAVTDRAVPQQQPSRLQQREPLLSQNSLQGGGHSEPPYVENGGSSLVRDEARISGGNANHVGQTGGRGASAPPSSSNSSEGEDDGCVNVENNEPDAGGVGRAMLDEKAEERTYRDLPRSTSQTSSDWCVICFENPCNTTLEPCGHSNLCDVCVSRLSKRRCPTCRGRAKRVRIYGSAAEAAVASAEQQGAVRPGQDRDEGEEDEESPGTSVSEGKIWVGATPFDGNSAGTPRGGASGGPGYVVKTVKQLIAERRERESRTLEDTLQVLFMGPGEVGKQTLVRKLLAKFPLDPNNPADHEYDPTYDVYGTGADFRANARIGGVAVRMSVMRRSAMTSRRMLLDDARLLRPDIVVLCCSAHVGPTFDEMLGWDKVLRANLAVPRVWALLTHPDFDRFGQGAVQSGIAPGSPGCASLVSRPSAFAQLDESHNVPSVIAAIHPPSGRPRAHYMVSTGDRFSIGLRSLSRDIVSYGRMARDEALAAAVAQAEALSLAEEDLQRRLGARALSATRRDAHGHSTLLGQNAAEVAAAAGEAQAQAQARAHAHAHAVALSEARLRSEAQMQGRGIAEGRAASSSDREVESRGTVPSGGVSASSTERVGSVSMTSGIGRPIADTIAEFAPGASSFLSGVRPNPLPSINMRTAREGAREVNQSISSFVSWFTGSPNP